MARKTPFNDLAFAPPAGTASRTQWLYGELRRAILDGRLKPGARLPSSRGLALQLQVARGTVIEAFDQLHTEGYVEARQGSGSYVRQALPEHFLAPAPGPGRSVWKARADHSSAAGVPGKINAWAAALENPFDTRKNTAVGVPLEPNLPALDLFPMTLWSRLAGRRLRSAGRSLLGKSEKFGYGPLREAVASHLGAARGVVCDPDQVMIVTGTQQTLDLIARIVLAPGDSVWMEDPGYIGASASFRLAGAKIAAIPVDDQGLDVAHGRRAAPQARLVYTTPAHQFPLGMSLSLERRLALLKWAQEAGAWIFEDDYDSEYRFTGRPLPALQSLDTTGRVIFAGSFNKMLFPTLRLGYVVLPRPLVEPFACLRALTDRFSPILDQAVLCDFLREGHFGQHVRRMREAYAERLQALLDEAEHWLGSRLRIIRIQAGLQTAALLAKPRTDVKIAAAAQGLGLEVLPLSVFQMERRDVNGLLLGFANATPAQIRDAVKKLAKVVG